VTSGYVASGYVTSGYVASGPHTRARAVRISTLPRRGVNQSLEAPFRRAEQCTHRERSQAAGSCAEKAHLERLVESAGTL